MSEFFRLGGWGMWPTLVFGLAMTGVGICYALRPSGRFVPLMVTLGVITFAAGTLGFVTGMMKSLTAAADFLPRDQAALLAMKGTAESLCNVALALGLVVLSTVAAAIGAWRLAAGADATRPGSSTRQPA